MNKALYFVLAAILLLSSQASAQEAEDTHPMLTSKYSANIGIYYPERSFKIGVDASVPTIERDIDLSEELKLGSSETTGALEFGWRFGERWLLRGQYFEVGGSRSATLTEDVVWGDYTFGSGTGISGGVDVTVSRLFVGRTWRADNKQEFGIGGGLHRIQIDAFIAGQAFINDEPPIFRELRVSTNGPLPNLGAWWAYAFTPKWGLVTRLDWLSASIDKYDGTIINAAVGINYAFTQHFIVGLNYNHFEIDVDVTEEYWKGSAQQRINGPFGYVSFHW